MSHSGVRVLPPGSLVVEVTWGPERHRAVLDGNQPLIGVDERGRLVTGSDDGRSARAWFAARGGCVYAMSVNATAPARVGDTPLPAKWSALSLPCSMRLGPLTIHVHAEVDAPPMTVRSGEFAHVRPTLESPAYGEGVTRVLPPLAHPADGEGVTQALPPLAHPAAHPANNEGFTHALPSLADPEDCEGVTRVVSPLPFPAAKEEAAPASGSTRIAPPLRPAAMDPGLEGAVTRAHQPVVAPLNLAPNPAPNLGATRAFAATASPPQAFAVRPGPSTAPTSETVLIHPPQKRGMSPWLKVGLAALPLALAGVWVMRAHGDAFRSRTSRPSTTVATSASAAPRASATGSSDPRSPVAKAAAAEAPPAESAAPAMPESAGREADRRIAEAMFAGDYQRALEASTALGNSDPSSPRYAVIARVLRAKAARSTAR